MLENVITLASSAVFLVIIGLIVRTVTTFLGAPHSTFRLISLILLMLFLVKAAQVLGLDLPV